MSRKIGKLLAGTAAYFAAYRPAGFWLGSAPPPAVTTGILLENGVDFLMLEDGVSYLLQE